MQQITSRFTSRCKQRSRPYYTRTHTYWSRPLLVAQYSIARSPLGSNDREHTAPLLNRLLENQKCDCTCTAATKWRRKLMIDASSATPLSCPVHRGLHAATAQQKLVQSSLDTAPITLALITINHASTHRVLITISTNRTAHWSRSAPIWIALCPGAEISISWSWSVLCARAERD